MNIFSFFRGRSRRSAETAKERLQILMAHERSTRSSPDFLPALHKELLAVIAKYVDIAEDKVAVKVDRGRDFSTLEVDIELPAPPSDRALERPQPSASL